MSVFCELMSYAEAVVVQDSELTRAPLHVEAFDAVLVCIATMHADEHGGLLHIQNSGWLSHDIRPGEVARGQVVRHSREGACVA
jgi:hypothetical protein